jgi:branched-chain amino acid aminotransferase
MMDYQGNIAEATGANIFFTKTNDNEIHTPIADSFLDGITRRSIIKIAKQLKIKVLERKIKLEELDKFDGCFLTGTAAEVTPVTQIGDNNFTVVDMIKKFDENYSRLVNKN